MCLDPVSCFGEAPLDVLVLLWRLEDLAPVPDPALAAIALDDLMMAIRALREKFSGTIILGLPPRPRPFAEGLTGFSRPTLWHSLWVRCLENVTTLAGEFRDIFTADIENEIAAKGVERSIDTRKELLYRQPYTDEMLFGLGEQIWRLVQARKLSSKKCIVVDCDNTLWGGIIGEDGLTGVELSCDFPGRPFVEFQRQLKALRDTGIFLAICSKNNPEDVDAMFSDHSGMVLARADISCFRVNWRPKSENIAEIASELNIGTDSILFLDDSSFEIEEVRSHLSAVTCIQIPADPENIPNVLKESGHLFDRVYITDDDRLRVDMFRVEQQRRNVEQKLTTKAFLSNLDLKVSISIPSAGDIGRVVQLINKTNQFNVTTRRYSIAEVGSMISSPDIDVFCAGVSDRFGTYGLVGVGIVRYNGGEAEIDSLLMSCRVLGRGVESSLIAHAVALAEQRGLAAISAKFIPSQKNGMVSGLFEAHGFTYLRDQPLGARLYYRDTRPLELPVHLNVVVEPAGQRPEAASWARA